MGDKPILFWKPYPTENDIYKQHVFSQWYVASEPFYGGEAVYEIHDIPKKMWTTHINDARFMTREAWMMYCKALLFANGAYQTDNIKLAQKILMEKDQGNVQKYGKLVKDFNQVTWDKWKYKIVVNGNYLQFSQNENMKKVLLNTGKSRDM